MPKNGQVGQTNARVELTPQAHRSCIIDVQDYNLLAINAP